MIITHLRKASIRRARRRRQGESGAVLVESAIMLMLLTTFCFGVVEFGSLVAQKLSLSSSTHAGARVGATSSTAGDADYQILQAVKNSAGFMSLNDVGLVVVFKDTPSNQTAYLETCKKGTPVVGVCNVYTKADFDLTAQQLFESNKNAFWPSSSRVQFTDAVGVYVSLDHHWLTKLFNSKDSQIGDFTTMQIQPQTVKPWIATTTTQAPVTTTTIKPTTTTAKPTTTTTKAPTTSTTAATTTTTKAPTNSTTSTTKAPTTTTTAKPTTTTAKPTTTTTRAPTTTTRPPSTIPSF